MRDDPATHLNTKLLQKLHSCPQLMVCGQALSHCVNFTVRDIVDNWRGENSKIVLLADGLPSLHLLYFVIHVIILLLCYVLYSLLPRARV